MKVWNYIRTGVCKTWVVPLLVALGSLCCAFLVVQLCDASIGKPMELRSKLAHWLDYVALIQLCLFLVLPLWLFVRTVVRLVRKQKAVWLAWLWSCLAGFVMLICVGVGSIFSGLGNFDDFTLGICVPEELAPEKNPGMAVPVGFSFNCSFNNTSLPPVVEKWADLCREETSLPSSAEEQLSASLSNLEKLAAEAPELLQEYKLRAMCHRALTPGTKAPYLELLRHEEESILPTGAFHSWNEEKKGKPLSNGWKLLVEDESDYKLAQLLDAHLAPLAANPTLAGLDAMVPPLPDKPVIVLFEGFQPGIYSMLIIVPKDYPEGRFSVQAHEYTQGKRLSLRNVWDKEYSPSSFRNLCRIAVEEKFTVYSGEWGEYYASIWDLYFTPAVGSPSRCVNSQLYLMQGWSR